MTRRRRTTTRVLAATAATISAAALLATPVAARDTHDTGRETLAFHDVTTATAFVDLNHNGTPDPGDSLIFHEKDHNADPNAERNDSVCVVALDDNVLCHVVVTLPNRGQIDLDGSIHAPSGNFPANFDLAVTGGTGDFARSRGYGRVHQTSDTTADDTIVILP
jgi:hypothetical protein